MRGAYASKRVIPSAPRDAHPSGYKQGSDDAHDEPQQNLKPNYSSRVLTDCSATLWQAKRSLGAALAHRQSLV